MTPEIDRWSPQVDSKPRFLTTTATFSEATIVDFGRTKEKSLKAEKFVLLDGRLVHFLREQLVCVNGESAVTLTPMENELLHLLGDRSNSSIKTSVLVSMLEIQGDSEKKKERYLEKHVSRLRQKIDNDPDNKLIFTLPGRYRLGELDKSKAKKVEALNGRLKLYPDEYQAEIDGNDVLLTEFEKELLNLLIEHEGRIATHTQIIEEVWKGHAAAESVYVHIYRLRKKLGRNLISTVKGMGWRIGNNPEISD